MEAIHTILYQANDLGSKYTAAPVQFVSINDKVESVRVVIDSLIWGLRETFPQSTQSSHETQELIFTQNQSDPNSYCWTDYCLDGFLDQPETKFLFSSDVKFVPLEYYGNELAIGDRSITVWNDQNNKPLIIDDDEGAKSFRKKLAEFESSLSIR
jgi:hypothetical protein